MNDGSHVMGFLLCAGMTRGRFLLSHFRRFLLCAGMTIKRFAGMTIAVGF
jgi:hypothetical protein